MNDSDARPHLLRFGVFEVDLRAGELRKQGLKVKLCGQPFQVLAMLLERPGELVTREEIREKLWPGDTCVDFEHSVNSSIKRLREALGDDPAAPRFIETLPRHGYRFIARVEPVAPVDVGATRGVAHDGRGDASPLPPSGAAPGAGARLQKLWIIMATVGVLAALLATLMGLNVAGLRGLLVRRTSPVPKIESIAVLPLENLSGDAQQEYFADGMTEALITDLGKISALRVISRTSVMRYKGTKKPLPEIAKELSVDALVEGTVLRSANRVRVTANLLHGPTDRHLWAETYERDLGDVLTLQGQLARAITKEIEIKVTPQEQARLAAARPINPEAYEAYLKGHFQWYRISPEHFKTALEYFQLALEKDPNYPLAYAGIANLWLTAGDWGVVPPREAFKNGARAASKAVALDDTLAEGHYVSAGYRFYYEWDWPGAEREYQRAIQLNPNYADVHAIYWDFLMSMRRPDEAGVQIERAVELDPHNFFFQALFGQHLAFLRRYDEAIEQVRKSLEMEPNSSIARRYLWGALYARGMRPEALTEAKTYLEMMGNREAAEALARGYAQGGYSAAMRLAAEKLAASSRQAYVPHMLVARLYAHAGEKGPALKWLEKACHEREPFMVSLNVDPFWDPLRSDPRFQDLLRRMNLPP